MNEEHDKWYSKAEGADGTDWGQNKTTSALNKEPDKSIDLVEYLADDDPICDDCQHPWALHGHDDGSCTVGAAWYDGRGAEPDLNACQCRDFKNAEYENWYSRTEGTD